MKLPGKNPGYGNRGKTNYVFPPFPQPLPLLTNQDEKRPTLNNRRSFTQNIWRYPTGMRLLTTLLSMPQTIRSEVLLTSLGTHLQETAAPFNAYSFWTAYKDMKKPTASY